MATEGCFHRLGNLAQCRIGARRLHRAGEQVHIGLFLKLGNAGRRERDTALIAPCGQRLSVRSGIGRRGLSQGIQRGAARFLIAAGANLSDPVNLTLAHRRVVDLKRFDLFLLGKLVLVDADNHRLALIDLSLLLRRRPLNRGLGGAAIDIGRHPARFVDLGHELFRLFNELGGERLDVMRAAQRIDDIGDAAFLLQHQLRVARNAGREVGGERYGFVKGVCVQALCPAQSGRKRFNRGANYVVVRVLLLQRYSARLAVRAQHL